MALTDEESLIIDKVKVIRLHNKLSQEEFSQSFNISRCAYVYYETKRTMIRIKPLYVIANVYNIDFLWLVDSKMDLKAFQYLLSINIEK